MIPDYERKGVPRRKSEVEGQSDLFDIPVSVPEQLVEFDSGIRLTLPEHVALGRQLRRIFDYLSDGEFHSIDSIAECTGTKVTSADAQVRNLRKEKHGGFVVEYRRIEGVAHYRLVMGGSGNDERRA